MKDRTRDLRIYFSFHEVQRELETLEELTREVEAFLAQEQARVEKWVEAEAGKFEPEHRDEFYETYLDDIAQYESMFPSRIRRALLVSQHSIFEAFLTRLCDHLQDRCGLLISRRDLRGSGVEQAKVYLQKVVGLTLPSEDPAWQDLLLVQRVRNVIVHAQGRVSPDDEHLKKLLLKHHHFNIGNLGRVELAPTAHIAVRVSLVQLVNQLEIATSSFLTRETSPNQRAASAASRASHGRRP